jgi:hypothetical protein
MLLDTAAGKPVWARTIGWPSSLTGEAPQVLGNRDTLLVLVARNYGFFWERLDAATGRPRWPDALFLGSSPADLEFGTFDATAVYCVQANALQARALADGRLLWQRPLPLPGARWRTLRTSNYLVLYPCDREAVQFRFQWPLGAAEIQVTLPQQSRPGGYYPVLLCEARTGELVERLNFRAAAPRFLVQPFSTPEPDLAVRLSDRGLAVVLDGKAWGLTAAPGE